MTTSERPDALPWQERQRRLREDAVLDAAAGLLAERGFAATSMDEIAARVGISKPTLYQHFPSKEAVAAAVLLRRFARAAADLDRADEALAAGASARVALEGVLAAILVRRAGLWATQVEVPRALLEGTSALAQARASVWARFGALVDRAKAEGDCRVDVATPVIVRLFAGLFRGDYLDLVDPESERAPEALAASLVSVVFDGLAPRPAGGPSAARGDLAPARRTVRRASAILAVLVGGGVATAEAQPEAPRPLLDQQVPAQTVQVPGVPAKAGGRAPGAPATPAAVSGRPLTLVDVLDAALRANPTARASLATAQAARAQYAATRGSWFPTLNFSPVLTRTQTLGVGAVSGGIAGDPTNQPRGIVNERTQFGPAVGLSYLLFDFGGRAGTVGAARENANAAEATFDATVVQTVLQAHQAYFGYQSARDVVDAQDANVRTAQLSRDAAVARFRGGLATVSDTLQAATLLSQARVAAYNARADLANALRTLATVANARADSRFAVARDSAPTPGAARAATAALIARTDTLVEHALQARPDVEAARGQALAATEQVRSARSALLPALTVTGAAGYQRVPSIPALTGTTYNVQLGLSFPLFDGGTRRATAEAATANADAARLRADATTTDAVNQVVTSSEQLRVAAERVTANDQLLATAARNEEVARGRYQEGVGTVVDLLTAQTLLFNARAQYAQARWAWATALAQLSRDAGVLGRRGELPAVAAPALPVRTPLAAPAAAPGADSDANAR